MRIDLREFRVLSEAAPDFFDVVKTAATGRLEGLEEIAAEASAPILSVIAPQWDEGAHELRTFLERNSVEFDWVHADDPTAKPIVRLRDGRCSTIRRFAIWRSRSACRSTRATPPTTLPSLAPDRPGWLLRSTARQKACPRY